VFYFIDKDEGKLSIAREELEEQDFVLKQEHEWSHHVLFEVISDF